jgi:hypothetical protein
MKSCRPSADSLRTSIHGKVATASSPTRTVATLKGSLKTSMNT